MSSLNDGLTDVTRKALGALQEAIDRERAANSQAAVAAILFCQGRLELTELVHFADRAEQAQRFRANAEREYRASYAAPFVT